MAYNFIECDRDQMYLLPVSMRDWLSGDHLAWFILDAVQEMDLAPYYRKYRVDGWGRAAYEPGMMVSRRNRGQTFILGVLITWDRTLAPRDR